MVSRDWRRKGREGCGGGSKVVEDATGLLWLGRLECLKHTGTWPVVPCVRWEVGGATTHLEEGEEEQMVRPLSPPALLQFPLHSLLVRF